MIGRHVADKFGWKIGDRFFLESIAPALQKPTRPFEFVVRGFIDPGCLRARLSIAGAVREG